MGFNLSKEILSSDDPVTSERVGYTRVEPAFGRPETTPQTTTNLNAGVVRTFPGPNGGNPSIQLTNNAVTCTWKEGIPEILVNRDTLVIQDASDSKLELEGSHDVQIAQFHLKTRRFLERGGKKGFCLGIDTNSLDPNSLKITRTTPENERLRLNSGEILFLQAQINAKFINMRIIIKNMSGLQIFPISSSSTSNGQETVTIEPVNSSGIIWIRTYY